MEVGELMCLTLKKVDAHFTDLQQKEGFAYASEQWFSGGQGSMAHIKTHRANPMITRVSNCSAFPPDRVAAMRRPWRWALPMCVAWALLACGGGAGVDAGDATLAGGVGRSVSAAPVTETAGVDLDSKARTVASGVWSARALEASTVFNGGIADPGLLMLLLPDDQPPADDRVTSWTDAASEVGTRMAVVTDTQFLTMGATGALRYAGLVLPDQLHSVATDALVAAVRDYTTQGGRTFLTFDFAALTLNGDGQPVYPIPRSRLSDLAGVDYVLYDSLLDRTVGLGPVTAMRSTLRGLLVPPGKSMPYPSSLAMFSRAAPLSGAGPGQGLLAAAGVGSGESLYLPVSPADPGGVRGFDPQQFQNLPSVSVRDRRGVGASTRRVPIQFGKAFKAPKVPQASTPRPVSDSSATLLAAEPAPTGTSKALAADSLDAYHGYLLGHLIYPSYVTTGVYTGTALASAPDFGLVAGVQRVGAGQVLFVNLPLGYLKGRTDALPMHGFLSYFMQRVVHGSQLSAMPNGVAGLTFDWHLDSMAAQTPSLALEAAGVFNKGPFSMEMTAGPDAIVPGDGLGWNLNNNPVAQSLMQRLDAKGHAMGSHGGWVHDFYGDGAIETNALEFLPFLQLNQAAVDGAVGKVARSYSAPQGNNPPWAMDWLEQQGVVGAYFGGHTGLGATRQYRDDRLKNPSMHVFPVTPQGLYATFEEFQEYGVSKQDVIDWYRSLVDFSLAQNTSRMVYAHPPGAHQWLDVMNNLLTYAQGKGAQFQWYTMPRLADFMSRRQQVAWTETILATGATRFDASHAVSLGEMVWRLPKDRYQRPVIVTGAATVVNGGTVWLVKAGAVQRLRFRALPNLTYVM